MRNEGHKTRCQMLWNDTLCKPLQCLTEVESSNIIKKTLTFKHYIKKESKVPLGWWWMWNDNRFIFRVAFGENSENTMLWWTQKYIPAILPGFHFYFCLLVLILKLLVRSMWKLHEFMGAAPLCVIDTYRTSLHYFLCEDVEPWGLHKWLV